MVGRLTTCVLVATGGERPQESLVPSTDHDAVIRDMDHDVCG